MPLAATRHPNHFHFSNKMFEAWLNKALISNLQLPHSNVKMLHSINPLLMVYVYFFIFKTANTQHHLFHHSEVLMSNLNFFFCRLILNFIAALELLQTWSCTYFSAAVQYIYRSGWIVSEMRHEHSLLSMWKSWPFCKPLSQSPATCIPQISPGSWLVFWPE